MQTISIEFGKKPLEITRLLEKKKIKKGDKILIHTSKDLSVESMLMYLLMLALSLAYVFKKKAEILPPANYEELTQLDTPDAVEDAIKKQFGVELAMNNGENETTPNPIDSLFGIWKDRDITIEQIREKAWGRNW